MKDYYQIELEYLRDLGKKFSDAHPALAPLLSSEGADPDVERILEGTAFLCGLINQRLDENFPEIIQGLLAITAPQLLLATPSQSLVQFTPLAHVAGIQEVKPGVELASIPVDNQSCIYTVMQELSILPCKVAKITIELKPQDEAILSVTLQSDSPLSQWWPKTLSWYLHDHLARASQWYMILMCNTKKIVVKSGGKTITLPKIHLQPYINKTSFNSDSDLLEITDWKLLRDYFSFPENFLFLQLEGLNKSALATDAKAVTLEFHLQLAGKKLPTLVPELFAFNVVPVINAFKHSADPFVISHTRQDYRLRAAGDKNIEIYTIESVSSLKRGGEVRIYAPYAAFNRQDGTYTVRRNVSLVNGQMEYYLGIVYQEPKDVHDQETIITELICYQPNLSSRLHIGDICNPTDSSPAMATFANIVRPTVPIPPIANNAVLWQLFSYLHTNLLPLASAESLQNFLKLYLPLQNPDLTLDRLNKTRIESIKKFVATPEEQLWKGRPIRGQKLSLLLQETHFTTQGEIYIFGIVLDSLLASFATINTYTRLEITAAESGDILIWPARLGTKQLI